MCSTDYGAGLQRGYLVGEKEGFTRGFVKGLAIRLILGIMAAGIISWQWFM